MHEKKEGNDGVCHFSSLVGDRGGDLGSFLGVAILGLKPIDIGNIWG